jgi:type I restriction enzyme R subunit
VKTAAGEDTQTVKVINWEEPEKNDFAIAEEVTLRGPLERCQRRFENRIDWPV